MRKTQIFKRGKNGSAVLVSSVNIDEEPVLTNEQLIEQKEQELIKIYDEIQKIKVIK